MKAYMARKKGIIPQYDKIMAAITHATVDAGLSKVIVDSFNLYQEVIKKLIKDGYTVRLEQTEDEFIEYYEISWDKSVKGEEGVILYVDDTLSQIGEEDQMNIDNFLDEIYNQGE
ncbi:MAG: hypothetical protein PHP54_02090 [Clostridia bacterium]|nr:hypothetical protein [Clostridia bacterium]